MKSTSTINKEGIPYAKISYNVVKSSDQFNT